MEIIVETVIDVYTLAICNHPIGSVKDKFDLSTLRSNNGLKPLSTPTFAIYNQHTGNKSLSIF